jgi:hypothetical protein
MATVNTSFYKVIKRISENHFLLLTVILVISFLPYASSTYIPIHDTYAYFQFFYYNYNHFFQYIEIAGWDPYMAFGNSNHSLFFLGPISFLVGLAGILLQIENVLLLYKISVFLTCFVFLCGLYRLCLYLFKNRATIFFVCITGILTTGWQWAVEGFPNSIYLMPFVFLYGLYFFEYESPKYFWLFGALIVLSLYGSVLYYIQIYIFIALYFSLSLLIYKRNVLVKIFRFSIENILTASLFIFFSVILFKCALEFYTSYSFHLTGREVSTGTATLKEYLTYGNDNIPYLYGLIIGWPVLLYEIPFYVGFLPLVLFILAIFKGRTRNSLPFMVLTFCLFWLSLGGFFSIISYIFPGLYFHRQLYIIQLFYKLPLIISSGFGLEYILSNYDKLKDLTLKMSTKKFIVSASIISIFLADIGINSIIFSHQGENARELWDIYIASGFAIVRIFLYAIVIFTIIRFMQNNRQRIKMFGIILNILILIDLGLIHFALYNKLNEDRVSAKECSTTFNVHKFIYNHRKHEIPLKPWQKNAEKIIHRNNQIAVYGYNSSFMMTEFPSIPYRTDLISSNLITLFKARHVTSDFLNSHSKFYLLNDEWLLERLGITKPKIRLLSNVITTSSENEEFFETQQSQEQDIVFIHNGNLIESNSNKYIAPSGFNDYNIKFFNANHLRLTVNNSRGYKWLIYADSFDPKWSVMVNSKNAEIYRANLAFKAVKLVDGLNIIEFFYNNRFYSFYSIAMLFSNLLILFIIVTFKQNSANFEITN